MKIINSIAVFILFINFSNAQDAWLGKKTPGFRVYLSHCFGDEVILEVGGTSLKMGGDYIILNKNDEEKYVSKLTKSYLKLKNSNFRFYYYRDGKYTVYKLRKVEYSKKIDKVRFNIFRAHNFNEKGKWEDIDSLKIIFRKFKNNPCEYIEKYK